MTPNHREQPPTPPQRVFIQHGYGHVGTGHTLADAKRDLLEKMRQAGEQ